MQSITFDWQWRQYLHDEYFHRDIQNLKTEHAIAHYVQHFTKYIHKIQSQPNSSAVASLLIDMLIISMSAANRLNCRLSLNRAPSKTIADAVHYHVSDCQASVARMSKVLEGFDHLEDINYRESLTDTIKDISEHTLSALLITGIESIEEALLARLVQVENRHIFVNHFHAEIAAKMQVPFDRRFIRASMRTVMFQSVVQGPNTEAGRREVREIANILNLHKDDGVKEVSDQAHSVRIQLMVTPEQATMVDNVMHSYRCRNRSSAIRLAVETMARNMANPFRDS